MRHLLFGCVLLAACSAPAVPPSRATQQEAEPVVAEAGPARPAAPTGAALEASGYATILTAPPEPYPDRVPTVPEPQETERIAKAEGISVSEAESRMNPGQATMQAANALRRRLEQGAKGNYVDTKIIRDPKPRYVFYFRRDAAATLRRFTSDPRFQAVQGGIPDAELRPLLNSWMARLQKHDLVMGGSTDPFEGTVELEIGVSRSEFDALAAREGWQVPAQVKLVFAPEIDESKAVAPDVAPFIRAFARASRTPYATLDIANHGRIFLRDGCFMVENYDGTISLALFGRDTRLHRDREGYLTVSSLRNPDARGRIGEEMIWTGYPPGQEKEPGVEALRRHCGSGPITPVGEPTSARSFHIRPWAIRSYATEKKMPLQAAWDEIKACFMEQDAARERLRRGEAASVPMRQCDSPFPINPPPPPRPRG